MSDHPCDSHSAPVAIIGELLFEAHFRQKLVVFAKLAHGTLELTTVLVAQAF